MRRAQFGATGHLVPVLGQGTWQIERDERNAAIAALRRGFDLGMTHIDTAELYGRGAAEALVAEALGGRRNEAFIVTKVLPQNASRAGTRQACERSLKQLKTDRIDCYLLHWRGSVPLEETLQTFEALRGEGKILSWGVSNFDVSDLEEVERIAGPGRIACNQLFYHPGQRAIEHRVLPWCLARSIAVVAYTPFGQSAFPAPDSKKGRALVGIAARHGATPRQVVLAFLTRGTAQFAIPKTSKAAHTEENAAAGDLVLSDDDVAAIETAFPLGRPMRGLPMV